MNTQSSFPNYFSFLDASTRRVFEEASKYQALIDKARENTVSAQVEKMLDSSTSFEALQNRILQQQQTHKKIAEITNSLAINNLTGDSAIQDVIKEHAAQSADRLLMRAANIDETTLRLLRGNSLTQILQSKSQLSSRFSVENFESLVRLDSIQDIVKTIQQAQSPHRALVNEIESRLAYLENISRTDKEVASILETLRQSAEDAEKSSPVGSSQSESIDLKTNQERNFLIVLIWICAGISIPVQLFANLPIAALRQLATFAFCLQLAGALPDVNMTFNFENPGPPHAHTSQQIERQIRFVRVQTVLVLRASPSAKAAKMGQLRTDTSVEVLETSTDGHWMRVMPIGEQFEKIIGWVAARHLSEPVERPERDGY